MPPHDERRPPEETAPELLSARPDDSAARARPRPRSPVRPEAEEQQLEPLAAATPPASAGPDRCSISLWKQGSARKYAIRAAARPGDGPEILQELARAVLEAERELRAGPLKADEEAPS